MYCRCFSIKYERKVFDENGESRKLTICYNALISGYTSNSRFYDGVLLCRKMREAGVSVVSVTMLGLVPLCMLPMHLNLGMCLHVCFVKVLPQSRPHVSWSPSSSGLLKINFDRAIFTTKNNSGIGVVIRDNHSMVIASLSQQLFQTYQAMDVEALVATRALEFASELGITNAILEGDSAILMKTLSED
nr:putative pentatricopeptide repeat-containing protein [Quercus suber]